MAIQGRHDSPHDWASKFRRPSREGVIRRFSAGDRRRLVQLGLSKQQVDRLERRLRMIRDEVAGTGSATDVMKHLLSLQRLANKIDRTTRRLASACEGPMWEAYGHLSHGAAEIDTFELAMLIDDEDQDSLPARVSFFTLVALIRDTLDRAISNVPAGRRAPKSPWRAIRHVVVAIGDPRLRATRSNAQFVEICDLAFSAATTSGSRRRGSGTAIKDGTIERAIREYRQRL